VELTQDLDAFTSGIEEITLAYSKKTKTLSITEETSQHLIDIKLDCISTR